MDRLSSSNRRITVGSDVKKAVKHAYEIDMFNHLLRGASGRCIECRVHQHQRRQFLQIFDIWNRGFDRIPVL